MAKTRIDSEFDAQKFLDEVNKEREKEMKASSGIPAGAVAGDPWDEPPAPNMHHDPCLWMWVPEIPKEKQPEWNPDTVPNIKRPGYSITGKKLPDDAELTNQPNYQRCNQPESHSVGVSAPKSNKSVKQEHQCTDTTVTPPKKPKSTSRTEVEKEPEVMPEEAPPSNLKSEHKTASEDMPTEKTPDAPVETNQIDTVEQSKKSRISSKKVDADFDELSHTFLHIVSLGEKKPVFLPLELRNALETLARLSGVPNLAPSHIVINILKAFFDEHRELINRKLSGVKLSI